jgi:hypothetical protein
MIMNGVLVWTSKEEVATQLNVMCKLSTLVTGENYDRQPNRDMSSAGLFLEYKCAKTDLALPLHRRVR